MLVNNEGTVNYIKRDSPIQLMSDKEARYPVAIYLIVLLTGLIFMLLGFLIKGAVHLDTLQSLIINLSTELVGTALIFFFVTRLFLLEESSISKRISQLFPEGGWGTTYSNFRESDIEEQLAKVTNADLCFMQTYLAQIMDSNTRDTWRSLIQKALVERNCTLRVLLLDSEDYQYVKNRCVQIGESGVHFTQLMNKTRDFFEECKNISSKVEIRTYKEYPIGPAFKIGNCLYQGFYLSNRNALECPVVKINIEHASSFRGFVDALERTWENYK